MATDDERDDERDIERFAEVVERAFRGLDPVPEAEMERARQIFALRSIDAELARLVQQEDGKELAGLRSAAPAIVTLAFASRGLRIEVEVESQGAGASLIVGQLIPEFVCRVTAEGPGQRETVQTDEFGRFTLTVSPGPIQLRVERSGEPVVVTDVLMA